MTDKEHNEGGGNDKERGNNEGGTKANETQRIIAIKTYKTNPAKTQNKRGKK